MTQITKFTGFSAALLSQRDGLLKTIKAITIDSRESLLIANNTLKLAGTIEKEVERIHKEGKAPALAEGKKWDVAKKEILDGIAGAKKGVNQKMIDWQNAEANRLREELATEMKPHLDRLEVMRNRIMIMLNGGEALTITGSKIPYVALTKPEQCNEVRYFLTTKFPDPEDFGKAKPQAEELFSYLSQVIYIKQKELEGKTVAKVEAIEFKVDESIIAAEIKSQEVGLVNTWTFEITDINTIPREFLMVDESKLKEYIKTNKASMPEPKIEGVRFFQKQSIRH
jgi:hypothetical protein